MITLSVVGTIGKDAEVRAVGSTSVMKFPVAHNERYKDKNGDWQTKTIWVDVEAWGEKHGSAHLLVKGAKISAAGTPSVNTYLGKDGDAKGSLVLRLGSYRDLEIISTPAWEKEATPPAASSTPNPAPPLPASSSGAKASRQKAPVEPAGGEDLPF